MKALFTSLIVFLVGVVLAAVAFVGYRYISGKSNGSSGISSTEAARVVPVPNDIKLSGKPDNEGVTLKWKVSKHVKGDYYDVYRRIPGLEGGWGEMIGRTNLDANFSGSYEFIDKNVENGKSYIYQVVLIKVVSGFEIMDQASNIIEVTYK